MHKKLNRRVYQCKWETQKLTLAKYMGELVAHRSMVNKPLIKEPDVSLFIAFMTKYELDKWK